MTLMFSQLLLQGPSTGSKQLENARFLRRDDYDILMSEYLTIWDMVNFHGFEEFTKGRPPYVPTWVQEFYVAYAEALPKKRKAIVWKPLERSNFMAKCDIRRIEVDYLRDDAAWRKPPPPDTTSMIDPVTLEAGATQSAPFVEPSDNLTAKMEAREKVDGSLDELPIIRGEIIVLRVDVDQLRSNDISMLSCDVPLPDMPEYVPSPVPRAEVPSSEVE
uniref:Integrase core domain containing protein n=1 Tax=Solanum tuberosum TaxID=4113 RepID=M1BET2_SOLTU